MLKHSKKTVILTVIGVVVAASAAFAYWTAGGSGTGSAATGTVTALTANQTTTVSNMFPGDAPQTISGNFNNPNAGKVYVATVTASIASVTKAASAATGTCDASDYTLSGAAMTVNAEVPPGSSMGGFTGAKIQFNNKATDQNACKGATVNLAYAIS